MLRNSQVRHFDPCIETLLIPSARTVYALVILYLLGIAPPADFEEEVTPDPNGETLTLEAKMQPLLLDSMTKSKDGFLGVSQGSFSPS